MKFLSGEQAAKLCREMKTALAGKQDNLTGVAGEVIGFDEHGRPTGYALKIPDNVATLGVDGILTETQRPSLAQITGGSNSNLLDNWYFAAPINAQGKAEYAGAGYGIDRWACDGAVTISDRYVAAASNFYQRSPSELTEHLLGKILTLSVLYQNGALEYGTLTVPTCIPVSSGQLVNATKDLSIYLYTNGAMQLFRLNGSHKIFATKVELGPVQTLAHKEGDEWILNDPPPERALELTKCQRYQTVFSGAEGVPLLAPGYATGTATAVFLLDLPTTLRSTPAIGFTGLCVHLSGARVPVTAAAVLGPPAQTKITIQVTCSSANFTVNQPCFLEGRGDYRLILDANL